MQLFVGSDNLLWLLGLVDNFGGDSPTNYITDAVVTATVLTADGLNTVIAGPLTLSYVAGSAKVNGKTYDGGNYRGQLLITAAIADRTSYLVQIVAISGSNTLEKRVGMTASYDDVN